MQFADFFLQLEYLGLSDVLLPFLLVFTIIFAALQKSKILGGEKDPSDPSKTMPRKNFNVVVALVMALSIIIPHVTGRYIDLIGFDPVDALNQSLPQVSIIVVAIIMSLLLIGIFGIKFPGSKAPVTSWIVVLSGIVVVVIFGSSTGWFLLPNFLQFLNDPEVSSLVIMILIFGLIIRFITAPEKKKLSDTEMAEERRNFPHGRGYDFLFRGNQ